MPEGEVVKQTFFKSVARDVIPDRTDVPAFSQKECCFSLPVLADDTGDYYRNDKHTILNRYDKNLFDSVTIFLQKYENGDWTDKVEFTDDTYGANYSYGTANDQADRYRYVAYTVEWSNVLAAFGEGTYRFRYKEIDSNLLEGESYYYFEFCLKTYTPQRADFTTRFDWYTKGFRGGVFSDTSIWDYTVIADYVGGDGWFNQIRLPDSFFGYNKSSYEREFVKFSNGQQVWLKDEQIESYTWNSGQYPADLHNYIKTEVVQADRILVTDYNKNNPNIIKAKAVNADGNYEPDWKYNNLKAFVDVDFVQEFQNKRKTRC